MKRTIITGTGSYIPEIIVKNEDFNTSVFYSEEKEPIGVATGNIIEKFSQITGIVERKYAPENFNTSDIGAIAAAKAIESSGVNKEDLDYIIVAHNFGNVGVEALQPDTVPSLASRIKCSLGINSPKCIPYDVLFGCPGWLQGFIQADLFFRAGEGKKALVIGAETLSRVIDKYDRDSMIFSDGAGACVVEYKDVEETGSGLLSSAAVNYAVQEAYYIHMAPSYNPEESGSTVRYMKMKGRKVYEFAITCVPDAIKQTLEKAGVAISDIKKIFIHQANEKMDDAIIKRLYRLYGSRVPENITPMSIQWMGNSSVATIPTLLDMVWRKELNGHQLHEGDVILFASVGAGMNVNAVCYRM